MKDKCGVLKSLIQSKNIWEKNDWQNLGNVQKYE